MWYFDIILIMFNWIKNLFVKWFKKDRYKVETLRPYFDDLITFLDVDKNGYVSYKEIVDLFKNLLYNLRKDKYENKK